MPPKNQEEFVTRAAPGEMTRPTGMVRAAAMAAAETFGPDEVDKHAQTILDAWVAQLKEQTRIYTRKVMAQAAQTSQGGEGVETAFWSGPAAAPYSWFDLLFAGPFQIPIPDPAMQTFLPHKVIRFDNWAFLLGALWRNPTPINYILNNPSAAQMTSAFNFKIKFECINLSTVADGPDFLPLIPLPEPIGGGPVDGFIALIPPLTFPEPPQGEPNLYEVNLTADVTGPGVVAAGLPFTGFATWMWDPDLEPPFLFQPVQGPHWHYDVPARFLVHA